MTSIKSAILSSSILFAYIISHESVNEEIVVFYFIAIIITFFIAAGMIFFTILPFTILTNNNTILIKKYFPIYVLTSFSIYFGLIVFSNFDEFVIIILLSAFITAMQSWVWLFKPKNEHYETT